MSNTAGMAMAEKEASAPMNMSSKSSSSNNNAIKNVTEYQTAQALASKAKEVLNKNLKSIAPSTLKDANTQIEDDLNQMRQ